VNEEEADLWHHLIEVQAGALHRWADIFQRIADVIEMEHEIIHYKLRLSRIQQRKEEGGHENQTSAP